MADTPVPPEAPWPSSLGPRLAAGSFMLALVLWLIQPMCTRDAPAPEDALAAVAALIQQGNQRAYVLIHPTWRTDVLDGLATRLPGLSLGPALPPDAMDGRRPVIAVLWPHAPEPGALSGWRIERSEEVHGVTVRFFHGAAQAGEPEAPVPPPEGAVDLRTRLKDARVRVVAPDGTVECNVWDARGGRYVCPGMDEWNYVGPRELPVQGAARQCLWAHPVTGATLSITFPSVTLGSGLRFGHALADGAAGLEGASDVKLRLVAGGTTRETVHANEPGWQEEVVPTTSGTQGDVSVEISVAHDGARHFCFSIVVQP